MIDLKKVLRKFVTDRAWQKYHRPKELAVAIMVEAAELAERFQWHEENRIEELLNQKVFRESVEDEMADILAFLIAMSNRIGIDLSASFERKIAKNELKYPVDKFYGQYEHTP